MKLFDVCGWRAFGVSVSKMQGLCLVRFFLVYGKCFGSGWGIYDVWLGSVSAEFAKCLRCVWEMFWVCFGSMAKMCGGSSCGESLGGVREV